MNNGIHTYCSDGPLAGNPRVHEEGRQNYERNSKSSDWFAHGNVAADPKPEARLRTDAARDIAFKSRGSMQENMQGYANPPIVRNIHPRGVRPEALDNAEGNKGKDLRNLIDNYGHLEMPPKPVPKVKGYEAEEYKEREQGSTKVLLNHFSTDPIPANELPLPARLRLGAEEIAEKHNGERMGPLMRLEGTKTPREPKVGSLHQESTGSGWDEAPPHHRMRPEGEGIAQKNSADTINEIILQNNSPPQRTNPKLLKHLTESRTPRKTPPCRVRLGGIQNLERAMNQTEMSAIMHGNPTNSNNEKKALPHMQRSELW
uniref:Uncharacterized protein n=1 Tax=Arion vulgaris TaxID=1028688 RepID=A0A0B7BVR3_9EUPU